MAKRKQQEEIHEGNTPSWDRFPGLTAELEDEIDEYGDPVTVSVDDLPELAAEYMALNQSVKEAEERKKAITKRVKALVEASGEKRIGGDFFITERVDSRTPRKLSMTKIQETIPVKMVELEIDPELISQVVAEFDNCYEDGGPYSYVKISPREDQ